MAVQLAELEAAAGATDDAVGLLRTVLATHPGHLAASRTLARTLVVAGQAAEAAVVVAAALAAGEAGSAPGDGTSGDAGSGNAALAELAGEICRAQGRHAAAVAAFGPRSALSKRHRRLRRRSWWRSGGPLRRRPASRTGQLTALQPFSPSALAETAAEAHQQDPSDEVLQAVSWANWLSGEARLDDARAALASALLTHGRLPELLDCAAQIEQSAGYPSTALFFWRQACQRAPGDVRIVSGLAECLVSTRVDSFLPYRVPDALGVLDRYLDQRAPLIRAARGSVLSRYGAPAARCVAGYGRAKGLPAPAARARRRLWWRSAGPLGQLGVWAAGGLGS